MARLLAFGGDSAASMEAQQAGLGVAVVATAVGGRDSPLLELSPAGVLSLLDCLRHLAAPDCQGAALLLQCVGSGSAGGSAAQGLLPAVLGLLHERHLTALQAWPACCGGGRDGVGRLLSSASELLMAPLLAPPGEQGLGRAARSRGPAALADPPTSLCLAPAAAARLQARAARRRTATSTRCCTRPRCRCCWRRARAWTCASWRRRSA